MKRLLKYMLPLAVFGLLPALAFGNGLTLTSTGISDGFALSTFATVNPGNTGCCGGPFGVAVATNGNIIVSVGGKASLYVFSDTDGQTVSSALFTQASNSGTTAYATAGGHPYGTHSGQFVEFNSDGTVNHVLTGVTTSPDLGMWGDPVNGHIIATSGSGLIDIDPTANGGTGSFRVINAGVFGDGVSVSPDGKTAYVEVSGHIIGYDIATGNQVFDSGFLPSNSLVSTDGLGFPDGSGVITSTNSLNGDIIVNFNGNGATTGGVGLIDPTTDTFSVIATGGTRGDYVSPDTSNGSLFMDYSDTVERLSCGPNCAIGGPPPPPSGVPEPGTLVLFGTAMLGLAVALRRRWVSA